MIKREQSETVAAATPVKRQRRPARNQGPDKWHFSLISDDPEEAPEYVQSCHGDLDPIDFIERSDLFEPGCTYLCKKTRGNGQIIGNTFTHTKRERSEPEDYEEPEEIQPRREGGYTREDLDRAAEMAARRAIERERSKQGQVDPLELAERIAKAATEAAERERERSRETQEMIDRAIAARAPNSEQSTSPGMQALEMLREMMGVTREVSRLAPRAAQPTTFDKIVDLGERAIDAAPKIVPVVATALRARMAQQNSAQPGPQQEQPQLDPQTETLRIIVTDLKFNKRAGRAADAVEELLAKQPDLKPQFEELLSQDDAVLLQQLSALAGEDLSQYGGALNYIAALKDELSTDEEEEGDLIPSENNGHGGPVVEGV
jgi:hypothetical protein